MTSTLLLTLIHRQHTAFKSRKNLIQSFNFLFSVHLVFLDIQLLTNLGMQHGNPWVRFNSKMLFKVFLNN